MVSGLGEDPALEIYTGGLITHQAYHKFPGVLEKTWLSRHGDPTFIMWANTLLAKRSPVVYRTPNKDTQSLPKLCLRV